MGFIDESMFDAEPATPSVGGGSFIDESQFDVAPKPQIFDLLGSGTKLQQATNMFAGGLSQWIPFGDEVVAKGVGAIDTLTGGPGEDQRLTDIRNYQKAYNMASPTGGIVESLPAMIAMPNLGFVNKAKGAWQTTKALAKEGGAIGALFGFAGGEDGFVNRAINSVIGGGIGAVAAPVIAAPVALTGKVATKVGQAVDYLFPKAAADSESLVLPQVQRALGFAEREGFLNQPLEKMSSIGKNTEQAIGIINQRAANLGDNIAAQLGAEAGDTAVEKAVAAQLKKAMPDLIESGIFQKADDMTGLAGLADEGRAAVNAQRSQLAELFDQEFAKLNAGGKAAEDMIGVVSSKTPEIQKAVSEIEGRVAKLSQNELSQPIAESLKNTTAGILRDINSGRINKTGEPIGPSRVIEMQQNLNEVRRNLLKEFDSLTIAKKIDGNTPGNLGSIEASIEAVSKLQKALSNSLESSVETLAKRTGTAIPKDIFTKLNERYGALSSLKDVSEKFLRGTAKGRAVRDPTRIVQNSGTEQVLPSVFSQKQVAGSLLNQAIKKAGDAPTDAVSRAARIENRDSYALKNIQDLISLHASPAEMIPNQSASLGQRAQELGAVLMPKDGGISRLPGWASMFHSSSQNEKSKPSEVFYPSSKKADSAVKELFSKPATKKDIAMNADLPPELVKAVISQESSGNPKAVSDKGATGLMQVMPATAKEIATELGVKDYDLTDPETNKAFGTYYLSKLMKQFGGDAELALTAYHSGPGRVQKLLDLTGGTTLADIKDLLGPVGKKYAEQVIKRIEV
jgi:hypothetical protein